MRDKEFNIAKKLKFNGYQRGFFDKKLSGGAIKNKLMSSKDLAEELHKPIIRNFKKKYTHVL